ncbi:hypothetical protein [Olleya sp. Bg11-27]|uniref:hypothetical protein n=1 Tax=Olleya sp. Bg11-27 TaxID=2058135 RepID=UPI0012FD4A3C|nr:hypothetical protein [Olleya sp. Bg11-27]
MKPTIYFKPFLDMTPVRLFFLFLIGMSLSSCNQDRYEEIPSPVVFTPNIPVDVDPVLQEQLKQAGDIYQLNQTYNLYSWQALIAINWPVSDNGIPKPNFTDAGSPAWLGWKEAFQVYREDGKQPATWGSPRIQTGLGLKSSLLKDRDSRVILSSRTPTQPEHHNIADETDQAFAGKLFDQNGEVVVYEVLMNKEEFDYIVDNKLYNINGQLEFSKTHTEANFPKGNYDRGELGATEIKLAWRVFKDTDPHQDRYLTDKGYIINETTGQPKQVRLGLIGFHISQKTPTGKQWVWSTFEHIDNLDQNVIAGSDGKTTVIHPTLTDPDCEICPVNVDATNGKNTYEHHTSEHSDYWSITSDTNNYYAASTTMKTQSKRMIDIPVRVRHINSMMQDYFKAQGSVWQYYQLIDTQYPVDQNAKPATSTATAYHLPESVINKSGGVPNIAYLTNITMETFFQQGNQIAGLMENSSSEGSALPLSIFGTESCIGCHSSAGIAISYDTKNLSTKFGGQLSGDFSWLLRRASWDQNLPKPTAEE